MQAKARERQQYTYTHKHKYTSGSSYFYHTQMQKSNPTLSTTNKNLVMCDIIKLWSLRIQHQELLKRILMLIKNINFKHCFPSLPYKIKTAKWRNPLLKLRDGIMSSCRVVVYSGTEHAKYGSQIFTLFISLFLLNY